MSQFEDPLISMPFDSAEPIVDEFLRNRGVDYGISQLYDDRSLCPRCVPALIELLKEPFSAHMHAVIARTVCDRDLNAPQKRMIFDSILERIEEFAGDPEDETWFNLIILNLLPIVADSKDVRQIGEMMLDPRYGDLRSSFPTVLEKIKTPEAISYLRRAAQVPATAALALESLAALRIADTVGLCENAMQNPELDEVSREAIEDTCAKFKRRLAKKAPAVSHITSAAVPKGLKLFGLNIDGGNLVKTLKVIERSVESGFGKAEISEVKSIADDLEPDGDARLKFEVAASGEESFLWLEVFCDDHDAIDLDFWATASLINKIETQIKKLDFIR